MYKMIRKQTRPNTSVPFFLMHESEDITAEMKTYFADNYVLPGKFLTVVEDLSEDQLEMSISTYWETQEVLEAFKTDPICMQMQQVADAYFAEVGITVVTVSESEVNL